MKIKSKVTCGFIVRAPIHRIIQQHQHMTINQVVLVNVPSIILQGFTGYLQVDGYAGYEKTTATLVGVWAHARRKFIEAQTAQPKR